MNNMKAGDESFMASVMVLNTNLIAKKQQNGTKWNGIKMQQLVYMVHPLSCAYILHLYACVMILLLLTTGAVGIEITPSKDQVHVAFENVSGICTFTCSGNGAYVVWSVDGLDTTTPHVVNKGISALTSVVSPDGRNITSRLSVPTIKSNNNTSVVCTMLDASYRNPQSAGPVTLLIQGILEPPRELKIHVDVHVSNNMSWIAPSSYDVSPAAIFHYVLSNNVSNVSEIIRSSCGPSIPCTASLDLNDPLLLLSHNTSILEYNGTIEFTYYAVNGAGNGIATTYLLRPSPGNGISTHPVPTTASGIANTNIATNNTVQINNTNDITKIIALTLPTTMIPMIIIITIISIFTFIAIKKHKKSIVTPPADPEHGSKTNEYIQTLCVTQQDDPYHVIVPLELRKLPHGHHNELGAHQTQPHIKNKVFELGQNMVPAQEATSTPLCIIDTSTMIGNHNEATEGTIITVCICNQLENEGTEHFEGESGEPTLTNKMQLSCDSINNCCSSSESSDSVDSKSALINGD